MSIFHINRKTDYAVRVILSLARRPYGARLSARFIQEETQVPQAFLKRIIALLSQENLIESFPGPKGGLQLARLAEEITLRDIVEVMEGPVLLSDCLKEKEACPLAESCPVRNRWGGLQATIVKELAQTTMAQLASEAPLGA
ncbi:MAG: Rrf2 family transcriptional regulator [Chloroflexi bacterium]|jgi:Rrf2 family transcriptional regulator, nitric oxide-sensitive transcriptional repressor|nr:Rrf2 family transcriptional regulator [Chloroflexota bacterium]